jgi:two-component system response regulator HydG
VTPPAGGAGPAPPVLVVDNDPEMTRLLARHLEAEGVAVTALTSGPQALALLEREEFAVVLTDLKMDDVDGLVLLRRAQEVQPRARVVLMTAFGSLETAIEALRHGAWDYLTKPFKLAQVSAVVRRALDDRSLRDENRRLRAEVERRYGFESLLGRSPAMQAVFDQIRAVAPGEAPVLLLGESGTGKELVARAIHWNGPRKDRPFVPVNCAAIPEPLLESELFGHEKGAFTGAARRRRGLFVEADGGTLFLDEIADMPLALQAKLLRALQDKAIRPVGRDEEVRVDLRIISATNRDLTRLVREGRFREDLYYRLAVIPIRLPSLRERAEDVPLLARHFLDRAAAGAGKRFEGFDEGALAWLLTHGWPGNVRELENVVERAATLGRGPLITLADLRTEFAAAGGADTTLRPTLAQLERQYVERVLQENRGDKRAAARVLGVSVRTLQRRFRDLGPR